MPRINEISKTIEWRAFSNMQIIFIRIHTHKKKETHIPTQILFTKRNIG